MDVDLIVDGHAWFARSYHAARYSEAYFDEDGKRVVPEVAEGTIPIALNVLFTLLGPKCPFRKPTRAVFCWDVKNKSNKNRDPKPPGYYEEAILLRQITKLVTGAAQAFKHNSEADDAVATACKRSIAKGNKVVIISGDKDLTQLVRTDGKVEFYSLHKHKVLTLKEVLSKFCVHKPIQIAIALALQGDPDDGIKGVHKWGPSKVKRLFESVPRDIKFEDLLSTISNKLKPDELVEFKKCLKLTYLQTELNVPEPRPLVFNEDLLVELGLGNLLYIMQLASGDIDIRC
jgi:5'-3' exonuclease